MSAFDPKRTCGRPTVHKNGCDLPPLILVAELLSDCSNRERDFCDESCTLPVVIDRYCGTGQQFAALIHHRNLDRAQGRTVSGVSYLTVIVIFFEMTGGLNG